MEGRLLQPLGVAFCVGLAASLLTALTLTPAMCLWLLPGSPTVRDAHEPRVVRLTKALYTSPLGWSLRHPWLVLAPTVALFVGAAVLVARAGRNFLPEFNEGALVVGVTTGPGTSLGASDELARRVETALMRHEEVVAIGRRTGRAEEDEHVLGVEASELRETDRRTPIRVRYSKPNEFHRRLVFLDSTWISQKLNKPSQRQNKFFPSHTTPA